MEEQGSSLCFLTADAVTDSLKLLQPCLPHHAGLYPQTVNQKIFPSINCLCQVFYTSNKTKNLKHSLTSDSSSNVLLGPHSPKEPD